MPSSLRRFRKMPLFFNLAQWSLLFQVDIPMMWPNTWVKILSLWIPIAYMNLHVWTMLTVARFHSESNFWFEVCIFSNEILHNSYVYLWIDTKVATKGIYLCQHPSSACFLLEFSSSSSFLLSAFELREFRHSFVSSWRLVFQAIRKAGKDAHGMLWGLGSSASQHFWDPFLRSAFQKSRKILANIPFNNFHWGLKTNKSPKQNRYVQHLPCS